jgi:hypothetical protein
MKHPGSATTACEFCERLFLFYIFKEADKWAFKQKQEKEMQEFLKRQKLEAQSFEQR